jgi:carboxyl-terminal processing protease
VKNWNVFAFARLTRIGSGWLAGLGLGLLVALRADVAPAEPAPAAPSSKLAQTAPAEDPVRDLITFTAKYDQAVPLLPGAYDSDVTRLCARILENMHYSRHPLDAEYAERFYTRYLEMLDPQHFHFTQEDLKEFAKYRERLAELTLRQGDTRPANEIFARYLQRVDQRVAWVAKLLQEGQFEFTGEDRYTPNRKNEPWPENLEAARALWRQHLRHEYLLELLNKQKPEEIVKKLALRYKRLLRTLGEFDREDILQFYLSALANAYDPHSDYMGKAQLDNFAISMRLSLFGIGALLRSEDGYCTIESLTPGGPAARSKKLKPKDRIIAVQQAGGEPVDVVDMKLSKVVEMIRGPKDTEVTLTIIPADATDSSERRTVTLVRDEIKLEDQAAKARLFEIPQDEGAPVRVGVIDLPSFYASFELGKTTNHAEPRSTTADVTRLIQKLTAEGISGLILDLRRNGGGSLEEAIKLTGLFIRDGPVVQVRDANGEIYVERDEDPAVVYDGPLVVLTSRFSASASEILAAALQDYDRALVVGDKSTHGKGTVQTIYELGRFTRRFPENFNPGALKVTIRKFYRANGASTQVRGVVPDIVLPSVNNEMEVGEEAQPYALPWDSIPAAKFARLGRVQAHLPDLRRRSEIRLATDPEWAYVREDIETYRKALADRSISLNFNQRVKEREEADARAKARKQEQAARTNTREKIYEITLSLAAQPGLPPPLGSTNAPLAALEKDTAAPAAAPDETEEEETPDKLALRDITLREAKRILLDLIELTRSGPAQPPVAAADKKASAPTP